MAVVGFGTNTRFFGSLPTNSAARRKLASYLRNASFRNHSSGKDSLSAIKSNLEEAEERS